MLHSKYLTAPLSFRRQCPPRNRMKNSVVAGNNLSSLNHMRPVLLPMITRSQQLKLSSMVVKASSQDTTVDTHPKHEGKNIKGRVVLMKKIVLDLNDLKASILDRVHELLGKAVSLRLISSVNGDPENESKGKVGKPAYLENWVTTITPLTAGETAFDVTLIGTRKLASREHS